MIAGSLPLYKEDESWGSIHQKNSEVNFLHKKGEVITREYFMIVNYLVFVNPRNIEI